MTLVAGVDGCPGGWVAVVGRACGEPPELRFAERLADLIGACPRVRVWAIDMPLSLPDAATRECDRVARRLLGPKRGASVFPAPPRAALDAASYKEGCRNAFAATGRKLSKQTWNLIAKIRETRALVLGDAARRGLVHETHPELSFMRLAGGIPLGESKKTEAGRLRRRGLIALAIGEDQLAELSFAGSTRPGIKPDDVLDAIACWFAAARIEQGHAESLPADPPHDSDGLRAAIVF